MSTLYDYEELYNTAPYSLTIDEEMEDYFRTFCNDPTDFELEQIYLELMGE